MVSPSPNRAGVIVAMPSRNRAPLLRRAVQSVLDQEYSDFTVLISDNASTDATEATCAALAASDPRVIVHRQATNLGLTGNYNWLMARALSDRAEGDGFFMFLSDDDWLDANYIGSCVDYLASRPDHTLVGGRTILEDEVAPPNFEQDVQLDSDPAASRLWTFCQDVLPTGIFSGVMPLDVVGQLPPQRNVLGHDWIMLANLAVMGKIATVGSTAIHRDTDGASTSLAGLAQTLGVSRLQAVRPLITIGYYMAGDCLTRSPVMRRLSVTRRVHLTCVVFLALLSRRAVPRLEASPRARAARPALWAQRHVRRLLVASAPEPASRVDAPVWASRDVERVLACPVCSSPARHVLYEGMPDQVYAIAGGRWRLQRCEACAAAYLDPRPASHAIGRAYAAGYYTHGESPPSPDLSDGLTGVRLAGRNAYVNRRYGYELEPASSKAALLTSANPRSRFADDRSFRHLRRPRAGARLLDVGCGSGEFVARAQALGWDAMGIDSDDMAISAGQASGLDVSNTPLRDLIQTSGNTFDAVTMSHVIEHVPDPVGFLSAARALLAPSGILWLVTPNLGARGHRRFRDRWVHLDPPRHFVLFDAHVIDTALAQAGFRVIAKPRSASGTIASFRQSWRIAQGLSPLIDAAPPRWVRSQGQLAGLLSLFDRSTADELIRVAQPSRAR